MKTAAPNIVLILADDMGYGDVGCYNSASKIPTVHLDRLASEGTRFTDAHAPSAVCTPTRYSILTGRYCWRSRLTRGVLWGYSEHLLEEGRITLGALLQGRGYDTCCIGKWHLGWDWPKRAGASDTDGADPASGVDFGQPIRHGPRAAGFDRFYGIPASLDMPPYCYVDGDRPTAAVDHEIAENQGDAFWRRGLIADNFRHAEVLDHLAERAIAYIREQRANSGRPFFLYFALTAPHAPILPGPRFRGCGGAGDYGDFCVQVDAVVGAIMEALERAQVADNTLLMFTSDNGPEVFAYDRARAYGHYSMDGLRGVKRDLWEGGQRVPLLVRWPGHGRAGQTCDTTVCLVDLLATVADILEVPLPGDAGEDSLSFLPCLDGRVRDESRRQAVVYHAYNGDLAIRRGDWVFIDAASGGGNPEPEWFRRDRGYVAHGLPGELYHLAGDRAERNNLYGECPDVVSDLRALLQRYRREGRSVRP